MAHYQLKAKSIPLQDTYDVIVVGGGKPPTPSPPPHGPAESKRLSVTPDPLATAARPRGIKTPISEETTTLGVRVHALDHRHEVRRETRQLDTPYGPIRVKLKFPPDNSAHPIGITPEFDDCKALAEKSKVPTRLVLESATLAAQILLASLQTP